VLNTIAFLKNVDPVLPPADVIDFVSLQLAELLPDVDEAQQRRLSFIIEQLDMCLTAPKGRRYSPFLIACATMWLTTSTALYNQLIQEDLFCLPSVRYLKRLSSALSAETGLTESSVQYLKARVEKLSARERIVTIVIDEVYCAKRVEFSGGKIFGMENNSPTKTLLGFMMKGVAGSYRDMVALLPITTIDSELLNKNWEKIVQCVTEIGFDVICISTDGHSSNRKFYRQELCKGKIQPFVRHPVTGGKIFLMFDPVHLFKNYFTNFLNRRVFECPPFEGMDMAPKFEHLEQLYQHELGKPVKFAHKLTRKVLCPRPIERCNVMLAERTFHESTVAALDYYAANGFPEWKGTAAFLQLIRKWWSIVNVRTYTIGRRKRDVDKEPVSSIDSDQIKFLIQFSTWLDQWQSLPNKKAMLSSETFMCAKQTTSTFPLLISYLLQEKGLRYVLLGKINSDAIERRFGHYRQLAGANYFLSVRQFMEAEKLIRVKALVKYSNFSMSEIKEVFASSSQKCKDEIQRQAAELLLLLPDPIDINFTEEREDSIIYYIAGYIARSVMKRLKCQLCADLVCESKEAPPIRFLNDDSDDSAEKSKEDFLQQINRGGLVKPSDLMFLFCLHVHELHKSIFGKKEVKEQFLRSNNHRAVFAQLIWEKLSVQENTSNMLKAECSRGHECEPMLKQASIAFCNCMMKNYVSELNDSLHESRKREGSKKSSPSKKKVSKLQSD
jgi:hypothetical protein